MRFGEKEMTTPRTIVAAIAASALLMLASAEAAPVSDPEGSLVDASALGAEVRANASGLELLVGAAEAGNPAAMNFLGVLYASGSQLPRDYSMAIYWFQKAIDRGSSDAMDNLARMYLVGMGVPRDYVNALRWFERSAAHGNAHSMYSAAVMAEEGLGISRDPKLARTMYRQAAKFGFVPAMIWVGDDYARGATNERDLVEAYAWLELALQSNVQEELQIKLLAKIDHLGARLAADRRDAARTRAMHLAELLRSRVLSGRGEAATLTRAAS
jgi:TPR repeat protein